MNDLKVHEDNKITKTVDVKYIKPHTPMPKCKQYIFARGCDACGCKVMLDDESHGEFVCRDCGLVNSYPYYISERQLKYGQYSAEILYAGSGYTFEERRFMRIVHMRTRVHPKRAEVIEVRYRGFIQLLADEIHLDYIDQKDAWNIVRACGGVHRIHSRAKYETILTGVCRYVIIQKVGKCDLTNLNRAVYKRNGLTSKAYKVISRNIDYALDGKKRKKK